MAISPGGTIRILILNASSLAINLAKHQHIAITFPPLLKVVHNKDDEHSSYSVSQSLSDSVNFLHYKPASDRPQQMDQHETAQENDDHHLKNS